MSDKLNKTVRTKCDIKVEVYQDNKRKYAILYDFDTNSKNIGYLITKGTKMDSSMSDDEVIQETLRRFAVTDNEINIRNNTTKFRDFYTIEQDPWSDVVAPKRHYGFTYYYLNNGCSVELSWLNTDNTLTGSYADDADGLITKYLKLYLPRGINENKGDAYMTLKSGIFYYASDPNAQDTKSTGLMKDKDIINGLISSYKISVSQLHGDNNYNLELCLPDTMTCSIIPYKSPIQAPENTLPQTIKNSPPVGMTQSNKFLMEIIGLPQIIQVKALEDLPEFTIYVIEKSEDLPYNPDEETEFQGEEEAALLFDLPSDAWSESDQPVDTPESTIKTKYAGREGTKKFQKTMIVNGEKLYNGEISDIFLEKLSFCGLKFEKHAARQLNRLNAEFFKKFGVNISFVGGYRLFSTQNAIFDWELFNTTGVSRKIGTDGKTAAAKPGGSQHGWGLALDTAYGRPPVWNHNPVKHKMYFDWLDVNGPKYNWVNPSWAKKVGPGLENWHFEYTGKDAYTDSPLMAKVDNKGNVVI
jgi:hypothetical protein